MFKLFAILSLTLLLSASPTFAETIHIYGASDFAPFAYIEDCEQSGFYPDLLKAISNRMDDYDIQVHLEPWNRVVSKAKSGEIFAFFPPYYRPVIRPWITQYSDPLYTEIATLFCHNDVSTKRMSLPWPEAVHGLTVGHSVGSIIGGKQFYDDIEAGKIKLAKARIPKYSLRMLMEGRMDCYIDTFLVTMHAVHSDPKLADFTQKVSPVMTIKHEDAFLGFTETNNPLYKQDFITHFNAALQDLRESGEYEAIVQKNIR